VRARWPSWSPPWTPKRASRRWARSSYWTSSSVRLHLCPWLESTCRRWSALHPVPAPSPQRSVLALALVGTGQSTEHLVALVNKSPVWDSVKNMYILDFRGRVTQASIRNFQAVRAENGESLATAVLVWDVHCMHAVASSARVGSSGSWPLICGRWMVGGWQRTTSSFSSARWVTTATRWILPTPSQHSKRLPSGSLPSRANTSVSKVAAPAKQV
jgi:hypothetical protein